MTALLKIFILREERNAQSLWTFLKQNWKALAQDGRPLSITVAEHKAKRSIDQNKRYWAILNDIAENVWLNGKQFSSEAWHEYFKAKFIGLEETPDGRMVGISTTALNTAEFTDFMNKTEAHAATELGLEMML